MSRPTWVNEMNIAMNHAPGAGSIARPVDQQSSALPLCYGCPPDGEHDTDTLPECHVYHNNYIYHTGIFIFGKYNGASQL